VKQNQSIGVDMIEHQPGMLSFKLSCYGSSEERMTTKELRGIQVILEMQLHLCLPEGSAMNSRSWVSSCLPNLQNRLKWIHRKSS